MGLPDSREIEPTRDDITEGYNNEPVFVANEIDVNEVMEDESDENEGYLRLRTSDMDEDIPANDSDTSGSDEDEDQVENEFGFTTMGETVEPTGLPSVISADSELEAQVWNSPRPQDTIELNSEKTQQILNAMSKFKLPNTPDWAHQVDANELIQRIRNKDLSAPTSTK